MLEDVIAQARAALPDSRYRDFAAALRFSLSHDPYQHSIEAWEPFGFSQRELYDLKVILLRPLAYAFVQTQGITIKKGTFDRKTSLEAYQNRYGRDPWLIALKPPIMALGYAEWFMLACDMLPTLPQLTID